MKTRFRRRDGTELPVEQEQAIGKDPGDAKCCQRSCMLLNQTHALTPSMEMRPIQSYPIGVFDKIYRCSQSQKMESTHLAAHSSATQVTGQCLKDFLLCVVQGL